MATHTATEDPKTVSNGVDQVFEEKNVDLTSSRSVEEKREAEAEISRSDFDSKGVDSTIPGQSPLEVEQKSNNEAEADAEGSGSGSDSKPDEEYITGGKLVLVLTALTLVYFLIMLDNTILSTAIPYITDDFHSLLDVGWYGSAYQLSCASLQPLTGKLYARFSSKWIFLSCLILFEIGSAVCGAAISSTMLIIGRAIAGLGGAGLLNGALVILNSSVPSQKQPALIGVLLGIGQLGVAFGPLIGGALTEYAGWQWCFYINIPIGAVVVVGIFFIEIPDGIAKPHWRTVFKNGVKELDLLGFALFAPAAIMFFLALQYGGNQYAWNSSVVIGLFCGSGINFLVWLAWDKHSGEYAMVPFSMLKKRIVWSSCLSGVFLGSTVFVTAYYLPIYFQVVLTYAPLMSGVNVLPNILTQMVFGIIGGGLMQKLGYYIPFIVVGASLNAIGCGLCGLFLPSTPVGQWVGYQIVFGTGRGLAMSVVFLAVQHILPKDQIPVVMSVLVFTQNFGAAVMLVIGQTILIASLRSTIPTYAPLVNPDLVISSGSTSLKNIIPAESVGGVLLAYAKSLDNVFFFCAGVASLSLVFAWFMGWNDLRKPYMKKDSGSESAVLAV